MKRYLSVVILATMIAGSFAIRMPVASALNGDENCFLRLLNGARADAGRRRLALAGDLVSIARRHSRWMAQDGTIYHADSHSPRHIFIRGSPLPKRQRILEGPVSSP